MTVNVLGVDYEIKKGAEGLKDCDGYCDETAKLIRVTDYSDTKDEPLSKKDLEKQIKKVTRHEILHAFAFESGLAENSPWAQNEEMIDWIAIQGPKIHKVWEQANAL